MVVSLKVLKYLAVLLYQYASQSFLGIAAGKSSRGNISVKDFRARTFPAFLGHFFSNGLGPEWGGSVI